MTFCELIQSAKNDGVTRAEDLPFLLQGSSSAPAVILVHGFSASPQEMRLFADYLHTLGLTCLAVRLPGHATSPEDLSGKKWEDWLDCADRGYAYLAARHSRIYGVGLSTGCLILLAQALQKDFGGLVLCSPYLKIKHRLAPFAGWLRYFWKFQHSTKDTREVPGYYRKRPVAGVHQINRLIRHLKSNLRKITVPALTINGEGDKTIDIDSGRELYEKLGSQPKIHLRFGPETPHVLISEGTPHYASVFELAARFIDELEQNG